MDKTNNVLHCLCDLDCGFLVQSYDKNEVLKMGWQHMKDNHPEGTHTNEDIEKMIINGKE